MLPRCSEKVGSITVTEKRVGCLLSTALTGNQTRSLGVCPNWESNTQPLGVQGDAPTN